MQLNLQAAVEALRTHVAIPLAVEIERAASGMLEVAIAAMANAVRHVTLEHGLDPRDFTPRGLWRRWPPARRGGGSGTGDLHRDHPASL